MQAPNVAFSPRVAKTLVLTALFFLCTLLLQAQNATYPPKKPSPPKLEPVIVLLPEAVIQAQWPSTLGLVNGPPAIELLNPGQCIRIGIYSTGDKRDDFLKNTRFSFTVRFAGRSDEYPIAPPSDFKRIKPEGGDFVAGALAAAGLKVPEEMRSMVSLGVSANHWCVPPNAEDGTATVEAEIEPPSGHQTLKSSIRIESFETGNKKTFKDTDEFGNFLQTYYRHPNPARLLPALQFVIADESHHEQAQISTAFLSGALRVESVAAQDFQTRIATQPPLTRAVGLLVLAAAGYDISKALNTMTTEEREKFQSIPPLQDPYDLTPTEALFQHLDMMWATFGATGEFKPVSTIASTLAWRPDYDDFQKLTKTPNHPKTLTPALARGVAYTAAGWSLGSFQRTDPLVADYIDYLLASPNTPQSVKSELPGLSTNPAFKQSGGK